MKLEECRHDAVIIIHQVATPFYVSQRSLVYETSVAWPADSRLLVSLVLSLCNNNIDREQVQEAV